MARETYNSVEHGQLAGTEVETEIREFVRRDVMTNRERHPDKESEMAASSKSTRCCSGKYVLRARDR